jgi:hypothetical protein
MVLDARGGQLVAPNGWTRLAYEWRPPRSAGWTCSFQRVPVTWTPCHFGGFRHWFRCDRCGQRAAKLYLGGDALFACRRCHGLGYRSQLESPGHRAITKARKLGWGSAAGRTFSQVFRSGHGGCIRAPTIGYSTRPQTHRTAPWLWHSSGCVGAIPRKTGINVSSGGGRLYPPAGPSARIAGPESAWRPRGDRLLMARRAAF